MHLSDSFKLTSIWTLICIFQSEESEEPDISDTPVGILTVVTERSTSPVHFSPASTAIVVEDELVMMDIATFANA